MSGEFYLAVISFVVLLALWVVLPVRGAARPEAPPQREEQPS